MLTVWQKYAHDRIISESRLQVCHIYNIASDRYALIVIKVIVLQDHVYIWAYMCSASPQKNATLWSQIWIF